MYSYLNKLIMSHKSISNIDEKVIKDFGNEWGNFDQSIINDKDLIKAFNQYFQIYQNNLALSILLHF